MSSSDDGLTEHATRNRAAWDAWADQYVAAGERAWAGEPSWGIWGIPERQLRIVPDVGGKDTIELGKRELARLGLVAADKVETGYVVRMPKAYPVYDDEYQDNVVALRDWIAENAGNVHPVGRNGMHKYNNQDHSMLTAMLAVENILGADHDVWSVNVEAEYHEAYAASLDRRADSNRDAMASEDGGLLFSRDSLDEYHAHEETAEVAGGISQGAGQDLP